ncbi:Ycf66 family protein [Trichocoleus sp. FACHB-591]|uniref:Ycf66 family protein n=1 Tax=Trichocoleus sp. FACHB-591 TaxID=2692872 RepID=UPI0016877B04|nr:Ycf66 family protein [Trichocoleus sp. FACHB-591]
MVNVGLSWSSMVGIALAIAGAALYFLRSVRPGLARDHDIFFAAVGLLCGGILFFQGWRQDPILQFGQFLLAGTTIFFAVESIRLRGVATEQAKRSTPIVDDERPVSRVYQAELDDVTQFDEEWANRRRIRGSRDSYATREDEYEDDLPRRQPIRPSRDERLGPGERSRRPRPRPESRPVEDNDIADASVDLDDRPARRPTRPNSNGSSRPANRDTNGGPKTRRPRPPQNSGASRRSNVDAEPSDYVDYQPINFPDDEGDNSSNFD